MAASVHQKHQALAVASERLDDKIVAGDVALSSQDSKLKRQGPSNQPL